MSTDRNNFITALFGFLQRREYLWLKATLDRPELTCGESDIDLFIKKNDLPDVLLFVSKQENIGQVEATDEGNAVFLRLHFADGSTLKVDLLTRLVRKQWTYLTDDYLFANRIWHNGIATYTPEVLLEHVLLFNFLNRAGLPQKYIAHFERMAASEQQRLLTFLNRKYGTGFLSFREMAAYLPTVRKKLTQNLASQPQNGLPGRLRQGMGYLRHRFTNKKQRAPKIITFSGVDGAGKTTLLHDLKNELTTRFRQKVVVLRHRPSLLPILSAWTQGKQAAEARAATTLPRQGGNRSRFGSALRFSYYYTDYLLGQVFVWLRYTLPGCTVIYDRYYFDFIVDGRRSNISLGERLPKWLYRFVAKPGLNIFLYADPALILQRKQELPAADIEQMTGRYRVLFDELAGRHAGQYLCIENTDRKQSLHIILKHYLKTSQPC